MVSAILQIQFQSPESLNAADVVACRQTIAKAITETAKDERKEFAETIREAIEAEEFNMENIVDDDDYDPDDIGGIDDDNF